MYLSFLTIIYVIVSSNSGGFGKKVKRVSDVASLGMSPQPNYPQTPYDSFNSNMTPNQPSFNGNNFESQNYDQNMSKYR